MLINQAMFRVNGNTGFVLKPQFLRPKEPTRSNVNFNPNDKKTWPTKFRTVFNIELISGQQLIPLEGNHTGIIDPYVKFRVHGIPADDYGNNLENQFKSEVIDNNGFSPSWQKMFSLTVHIPELAMLEVQVVDDNRGTNDTIGYNFIPMHLIQEGYRFIPLFNIRNDSLTAKTAATLFVKVQKEVKEMATPPLRAPLSDIAKRTKVHPEIDNNNQIKFPTVEVHVNSFNQEADPLYERLNEKYKLQRGPASSIQCDICKEICENPITPLKKVSK